MTSESSLIPRDEALPDSLIGKAARLLFRFTEAKTREFPRIMEAAALGEMEERSIEYHGKQVALFEVAYHLHDLPNTQAASSLALWLGSHRFAEAFGNGHRLYLPHLLGWLHCYERSFMAPAKESYCWTPHSANSIERQGESAAEPLTIKIRAHLSERSLAMKRDPPNLPPVPTWLSPCRQLTGWLRISTRHPATIREQVESELVSRGCRHCPHLDDLDDWERQQWGVEKAPEQHSTLDNY